MSQRGFACLRLRGVQPERATLAGHCVVESQAELHQPASRFAIAMNRHQKRQGLDQARRVAQQRSEEHTSELQSLMRISYAVFCLKKKKAKTYTSHTT